MGEALGSAGRFAALLVYEVPPWRLGRVLWRFMRPEAVFAAAPVHPTFSKVCGTGAGMGFSLRPHWTRFAIFTTWRSPDEWGEFLRSSSSAALRESSRSWWWMGLTPHRVHGRWDGGMPLAVASESDVGLGSKASEGGQGARIAVLTRASIRLSRLHRFWSYVPQVQREIEAGPPGLELTLGFGELPWVRQATLSVWRSQADMEEFAYRRPQHREVVRLTREERWYSEEMFARFSVDGPYGPGRPMRWSGA